MKNTSPDSSHKRVPLSKVSWYNRSMNAHNFIDLSGQIFGRLIVIKQTVRRSPKVPLWLCRCDCGKLAIVEGKNLRGGLTSSCGCLHNESIAKRSITHGLTDSPEYKVWCGMKRRCYNKNEKCYERYGARGITVCDRWLHSFENFLADMGARPSAKHTIDRIDNNNSYSPDNCRWILHVDQCANRRSNVVICYNNETRILSEWAKITGLNPSTIKMRLKLGWSPEKALTQPTRLSKENP